MCVCVYVLVCVFVFTLENNDASITRIKQDKSIITNIIISNNARK
jgi:hypothetical protein